MNDVPRSPYAKTDGLYYFPRMLDKIRLFASGNLRSDLQANLGKGFDALICHFLRVDYDALRHRTLQGGSDEDVLDWCRSHGRDPDETDALIWNEFISKRGWNDPISEKLALRKADSGLQERDNIHTMFQYLDADEGR